MATVVTQRTSSRMTKASRLVDEGRVTEVAARTFVVAGDTPGQHYLVTISVGQHPAITGTPAPHYSCTCTWGRGDRRELCSHALAARAIIIREQDPFDLIARGQGRA